MAPRVLGLLAALSLLLPATALQQSFLSSMDTWGGGNFLQVSPVAQTRHASAQARLAQSARLLRSQAQHVSNPHGSSAAKIKGTMNALQLGANHSELVPIVQYLDDIITQLDAQDAQDTALLHSRTVSHTAAVEAVSEINGTVALKQTASSDAAASCTRKERGFDESTLTLSRTVTDCERELEFTKDMKAAMNRLTQIGEDGLGFVQTSPEFVQTMISSLTDKIKSASASAKAKTKSINLLGLGTHYGVATTNMNDAIIDLEDQITAKKVKAQEDISKFTEAIDDVCAGADAEASQVVEWVLKQNDALVQEEAQYADLVAATAMVTASRHETSYLRTKITHIKAKIQELADIPATEAIQKMPGSMLQMHMAKFEGIVESIKDLLRTLHARVVADAATETAQKDTKHSTWLAAKATYEAFFEDAAVQSANFTTLGTRLAVKTGIMDEARDVLEDEIESQLRETNMFNQLKVLLTALESQGSVASALATQPSTKAMLALAVGAERSHEDLTKRFDDLITALQNEMMLRKAKLQADLAAHVASHNTVLSANTHQLSIKKEADDAKESSRGAMEAALAKYETATSVLDANNLLRQAERALISTLLTMVDELKA